MANYSVPPTFRRSLEALAQLAAPSAEQLIDEVLDAAPFEPSGRLESLFSSHFPDDPVAGELLAPALMSLKGQARRDGVQGIAQDVAAEPNLALSGEARTVLAGRLEALLGAPSISTTAAALELLTQHERNYQQARVVCDIRPVFTDDVEDEPSGAVIVEMMSIVHWGRTGSAETFTVALDETDLRQMQATIERALAKTETLKRMLDNQGIHYYELD